MIKINLALRKSAVPVTDSSGKTKQISAGAQIEGLKELPIRKFALTAVVAFGMQFLLDGQKEEEMATVDSLFKKVETEQTKLRAESAKMKGLEEVRKQLEADEFLIKTKVDTIQKLLQSRSQGTEILATLSKSIPADVWLNQIQVNQKELQLKGSSLGFNQISDFMKSLSQVSFMSDLRLQNTTQTKEDGVETAAFELVGKRK